MRTLNLDIAKWRCGPVWDFKQKYGLGSGDTALLNKEGFMCCLGQFAKQVLPEKTKDELLMGETLEDILLNLGEPLELSQLVGVYDDSFIQDDNGTYLQTQLAELLIRINDDQDTTVCEKVLAIEEQLSRREVTLTLTNVPDWLQKELDAARAKNKPVDYDLCDGVCDE